MSIQHEFPMACLVNGQMRHKSFNFDGTSTQRHYINAMGTTCLNHVCTHAKSLWPQMKSSDTMRTPWFESSAC